MNLGDTKEFYSDINLNRPLKEDETLFIQVN